MGVPRVGYEKPVFFVPDGVSVTKSLDRTTHLAIACHPDDAEIGMFDGAVQCYGSPDKWFYVVTVTDGAGSPAKGKYADFTPAEMTAKRQAEQIEAARIGQYSGVCLLKYPSGSVKERERSYSVVDDLRKLITRTEPAVVYTHNPADKHPTHVATFLRVLHAMRDLKFVPDKFLGCEVWRDLDWLPEEYRRALDVSGNEELARQMLEVYDSQIAGGKRYDLATLGLRRAHATYDQSHGVDTTTGIIYAMDLKPLLEASQRDVAGFMEEMIRAFSQEVMGGISVGLR